MSLANAFLHCSNIEACAENAQIDPQKAHNYRAYSLLAAYTGLRPSTIKRLTIDQFKTALNEEKPVLHVLAEQEKSRVEHYVPLHPAIVEVIKDVLKLDVDGKDGDKPFFMYISFEKWRKRQKIPLPRVRDPKKAHLGSVTSVSSPNNLELDGMLQIANMY